VSEIKVAYLMTAATAVRKLDILSDDADWEFNFNTAAAGANGLGKLLTSSKAQYSTKANTSHQEGQSSPRSWRHSQLLK
jgi:hypothetical protein